MSHMSEVDAAGATVEEVWEYMEAHPKEDHDKTFEAALDHFHKRKEANEQNTACRAGGGRGKQAHTRESNKITQKKEMVL